MRVVIIKDFVKSNFPATPLLDYALEVEKITTSKVYIQHHTQPEPHHLVKYMIVPMLCVWRLSVMVFLLLCI